MKRRDLLTGSAGLALTMPLAGCDDYGAANMPQPPAAVVGADGQRRLPWQNWSGYQSSLPERRLAPASEDELARLLHEVDHFAAARKQDVGGDKKIDGVEKVRLLLDKGRDMLFDNTLKSLG